MSRLFAFADRKERGKGKVTEEETFIIEGGIGQRRIGQS